MVAALGSPVRSDDLSLFLLGHGPVIVNIVNNLIRDVDLWVILVELLQVFFGHELRKNGWLFVSESLSLIIVELIAVLFLLLGLLSLLPSLISGDFVLVIFIELLFLIKQELFTGIFTVLSLLDASLTILTSLLVQCLTAHNVLLTQLNHALHPLEDLAHTGMVCLNIFKVELAQHALNMVDGLVRLVRVVLGSEDLVIVDSLAKVVKYEHLGLLPEKFVGLLLADLLA